MATDLSCSSNVFASNAVYICTATFCKTQHCYILNKYHDGEQVYCIMCTFNSNYFQTNDSIFLTLKKLSSVTVNVMVQQKLATIYSHLVRLTFNWTSSDSDFITRLRWASSLACSFSISDFWYDTSFWSLLRNFDCLSNSFWCDSNDCWSSRTSNFHLPQHQCSTACSTQGFYITFYSDSFIVHCMMPKQVLFSILSCSNFTFNKSSLCKHKIQQVKKMCKTRHMLN